MFVNNALHLVDTMPRIDFRLSIALAAGRIAGMASRWLKIGGGTTLPGVIAERVDPHVLSKLSVRLSHGTILVTGTNGKTTTTRLLATILKEGGLRAVNNRAGANLRSGLTTALLRQSDLSGNLRAEWGLFEVDEAVMPSLIETVKPAVVVVTNLFRDQLDRYGEIDYIASRWREALSKLPSSASVVLNADDPAVASLALGIKAQVIWYGVTAPCNHASDLDRIADSKSCPVCGSQLEYSAVQYAHLGDYQCPAGDFRRPSPDVAVTAIDHLGVEATEIELSAPFGRRRWRIGLPGLYNSYNVLAAVTGALAVGVPSGPIDSAITDFRAAFGRFERIQAQNRTLCVILIKNPVGFTEVIRTILAEKGERHLAILINDNLADGTDVSWLWDAEVEGLANRCRHVVVGGTRASDMAVRLKYAGVPTDRIEQVDSVRLGIDRGLAGIPDGGTLYALPTYTAMIELREIAARRRYAASFWKI